MAPKQQKNNPCSKSSHNPKTQSSSNKATEKIESLSSKGQPKPWSTLNQAEKSAFATRLFVTTGAWKNWPEALQREFLKSVEGSGIDSQTRSALASSDSKLGELGSERDRQGRSLSEYSEEELERYREKERDFTELKKESWRFRERWFLSRKLGRTGQEEVVIGEEEVREEKKRRARMVVMDGRRESDVGRYGVDPEWDDVVPLVQEESLGALASIAYTAEYAEAISYLRAVMATSEHSPRILTLTSHIISLNPAHYTVWLYRARTLFALSSDLLAELSWLNEVALENQKNYQIWHHRQLIIEFLHPSPSSTQDSKNSNSNTNLDEEETALTSLIKEEFTFMNEMFTHDSKNYHVWSYRQWLIRHLNIFSLPALYAQEIDYTASLIQTDIRNNSAYSHRFFLVFNNPEYCSPSSKPTEPDEKLRAGRGKEVVEREVDWVKVRILEAPQNLSAWGYLRGVLGKGGCGLGVVGGFVGAFVRLGGKGVGEEKEDIKSSHALEFLADMWAEERGEKERADADRAFRLLGDKYDPVRRNYWEWRREGLGLGVSVGGQAVCEVR